MARSLQDRCREEFSHNARSNGNAYFRSGAVQIRQTGDTHLAADVKGSDRSPYDVKIDWSLAKRHDALQVECTCHNFQDGHFCKHVWATLAAMDQAGYSARIKGGQALDVYHGLDKDFEDDEGDQPFALQDEDEDQGVNFGSEAGQLGPLERALVKILGRGAEIGWGQPIRALPKSTGKPPAAPPPPPAWSGVVDFVARACEQERRIRQAAPQPTGRRTSTGRLLYLVNVDECRRTGELVVDLFEQSLRKNGQWGVPKSPRLDRDQIDEFPEAVDREAVALLVGHESRHSTTYGFYGFEPEDRVPSRFLINTALFDLTLPKLHETGRLGWYGHQPAPEAKDWRPLAWDTGPPYTFRCAMEEVGQPSGWRLSGVLERGEESISLAAPVLLLGCGVVMFDDRLSRLSCDVNFPWLAALRATPVLEIGRAHGPEFAHAIWSADVPPPCDLPEELRYEVVTETPQPMLRIESPDAKNSYLGAAKGNLFADLVLQYNGREWRAKDPITPTVDRAQRIVFRRDRAAEQAALERLDQLGVREPSIYWNPRGKLVFAESKLPVIARTLTGEGWVIEAQGLRIKSVGQFRLSVTSGVDWFDLEGDCDFGDAQIGIPEVLAAIRKGNDYVQLADGSRGLLPETWLKQLRRLSELGSEENGKLRFKPNQALLLDSLLAALPACDLDKQFRAVRQQLHSFGGVGAVDPPDTFTGKLREYQREGLGWLAFLRKFHFGGCLADDMGLGKTVQVLAALDSERTRQLKPGEKRAPSLVVVPRSLVHNWQDEAARFTPKLKLLNYTGLSREGLLDQLHDHHLVVTTYGTLRRDIDKLRQTRFNYAILDEAQAVKNSAAQASKAVRLLQADHRLAISGTPVENHLGELWSLFEFLNPGMLGGSALLQDLTRGPANADGLAQLASALRPFILRRTKEEVLKELPEKTEQTIYCELETSQRKLYDELRDHYRAKLAKQVQQNGVDKSRIYVLEALLRLRQAACHPGLLEPGQKGDSSAKFDTLFEQLEEILDEGHKALVFSQFTSLLDLVRIKLDKMKTSYAYLDGRTRKRAEAVQRFQTDPNCKLFLISLKAGGLGLNLTAADYVFILDPWWNPAVEAQAIDRAHRLGQARPVFAYRLIARDTVEEKIVELQREKKQLADALVSADVGPLSALTADDIERLLS